MTVTVQDVMRQMRNYFIASTLTGTFTVADGIIDLDPPLAPARGSPSRAPARSMASTSWTKTGNCRMRRMGAGADCSISCPRRRISCACAAKFATGRTSTRTKRC